MTHILRVVQRGEEEVAAQPASIERKMLPAAMLDVLKQSGIKDREYGEKIVIQRRTSAGSGLLLAPIARGPVLPLAILLESRLAF